MSSVPDPPVPATADCRSLDYMPLKVARLLASDTWAVATGDEAKAAVTLWCWCWHQVPAGSVPNDEKVLAVRSGAGSKWTKVRAVALRGFVLCSDGRLYHQTICEEVLEALDKREKWRRKKHGQRHRSEGDSPPPEHDVHPPVPGDEPVDSTGTGGVPNRYGTGRDSEDETRSTSSSSVTTDSKNHEGNARHDVAAVIRPPSPHRSNRPRSLAAVLPVERGPPEPRLKRQDRADNDMAKHLTGILGYTPQRAWEVLMAARSPEDPEHAACCRLLSTISAENRLGWFATEELPA